MRFEWSAVIEGRPASKKNSRRIFRNRSFPSEAYLRFNASALSQLKGKTPAAPYAGDVIVEVDLYLKGRLRQDASNAYAGIEDTLMDAGVIVDDDQVVEVHCYKHRGASDWRSEVHVVSVE